MHYLPSFDTIRYINSTPLPHPYIYSKLDDPANSISNISSFIHRLQQILQDNNQPNRFCRSRDLDLTLLGLNLSQLAFLTLVTVFLTFITCRIIFQFNFFFNTEHRHRIASEVYQKSRIQWADTTAGTQPLKYMQPSIWAMVCFLHIMKKSW